MTTRLDELQLARLDMSNARAAAVGEAAQAGARVAELRRRTTSPEILAQAEQTHERAVAELGQAQANERRILDEISVLVAGLAGSPIEWIAKLDARHPIACFPVRIETRFRRGDVGKLPAELLVRIYPDALMADTHEPVVTAGELAAGEAYWHRVFDGIAEAEAWSALLGEATAERAAWIVERTTPTNIADRPAEGSEPGIVEPAFEPQPTRPENWHRGPEARLLPERWIVSAFRDGARLHQVISGPVREGLALSLKLSGDGGTEASAEVDISGDGLRIDPELRWVYDFEEAERAGMALRIPLTPADLDEGFSTILVVGVRTQAAPEPQAHALAALLASHRFSRGLAFIPQGAKTNNTQEASSDYPPADLDGATSFAIARGTPRATPGTDGERVARALGLSTETFDHVAGAERDEQSPAQAMADALWPVTIGYFLKQMMAPEIDVASIDAVRDYVRARIRGRGHHSALRIGAVPYGVLPVGALNRWPAGDDKLDPVRAELPRLLQRLQPIWARAAAHAPHVGRSSDPDKDLVELLAQDASAQTIKIRYSAGGDTSWNLLSFAALDPTRWQLAQRGFAEQLLQAIGQPDWAPQILEATFGASAYDFAGPLVDSNPLSETAPLAFDYIAWLRTASPEALEDQLAPPTAEPLNALLYLMLRHALLAEYDQAGRGLLRTQDLLLPTDEHEPELVGIFIEQPSASEAVSTRTAWDRFDMTLPAVTGTRTIGGFLADPAVITQPHPADIAAVLGGLASYRASLAALEGLPTAELQRLFTETLDIASHRIDAWITSLYVDRLETMRASHPHGLHVACYGWVEALQADPPVATTSVALADGRIRQARLDSGGFVYAPSMLHGVSAAVLRSAYLTRGGESDGGAYAVNLSSQRVRLGLDLIDSVRDQQPLGAALGYQFERGLHENHPGVELDRFIDPLRTLYPLVANKAEPSGASAQSVAARNVVDGLLLRDAWRRDQIPWGQDGLTPDAAQRSAVEAELARLDDAVDAVGDLLLAESVHQVVKGSTAGASATLDTLAKGRRAPEPEVVATPRSGTALHHRVALVLPEAPLPAEWSALGLSPAAEASPELNAWLAGLLGLPGSLTCVATQGDATSLTVTLAMLGIQPIDLLQMTRASVSAAPGPELDRRVAWYVAGATEIDGPLAIDYTSASVGALSLAEGLELLQAAGRMIGLARPLEPRDLMPPELESEIAGAETLPTELAARAAVAHASLRAVMSELDSARAAIEAAPSDPTPDLTALRVALTKSATFGLRGVFPASRHANDPAARAELMAFGARASGELHRRNSAAVAGSANSRAVFAALFGKGLPIVPRFMAASSDLLAPALASEPDLGSDGDEFVEFLALRRCPSARWRRCVAAHPSLCSRNRSADAASTHRAVAIRRRGRDTALGRTRVRVGRRAAELRSGLARAVRRGAGERCRLERPAHRCVAGAAAGPRRGRGRRVPL